MTNLARADAEGADASAALAGRGALQFFLGPPIFVRLQQTHQLSIYADATFTQLVDALYARHTRELRVPEIRRALQALSTIYVQRRDKLQAGLALHGAGKRAAFALYYAPLHIFCLRAIFAQLPLGACRRLVDAGCGTGAASIAYAQTWGTPAEVLGLDANDWALQEATYTWRLANLRARGQRCTQLHRCLRPTDSVLLAFVANELDEGGRNALLATLVAGVQQAVVVEPIATRAAPWYPQWEHAFVQAGGRSDVWHLRLHMPERWRVLDHAAGMRHETVKLRSLYMGTEARLAPGTQTAQQQHGVAKNPAPHAGAT